MKHHYSTLGKKRKIVEYIPLYSIISMIAINVDEFRENTVARENLLQLSSSLVRKHTEMCDSFAEISQYLIKLGKPSGLYRKSLDLSSIPFQCPVQKKQRSACI